MTEQDSVSEELHETKLSLDELWDKAKAYRDALITLKEAVYDDSTHHSTEVWLALRGADKVLE